MVNIAGIVVLKKSIIFSGKIKWPGNKKCPVGTPATTVKKQYFPDSPNQLSFPSTVLHRRNFYKTGLYNNFRKNNGLLIIILQV